MEALKAAVLQNGQYGAMLHYFYKLSEENRESKGKGDGISVLFAKIRMLAVKTSIKT